MADRRPLATLLSTAVPTDEDAPGQETDDWWSAGDGGVHRTSDLPAFGAFFAANHEAVLRSVTAATGNRELADDATQDAFIKAHARWSTLRSYQVPEAWVKRVAINVSRDRLRSDRRRRDREAATGPDVAPDLTEAVEADTGASALLAELTPRQREIARLFYVEDHSIDEIAKGLGLDPGTVKFHLARARDRLRQTTPS